MKRAISVALALLAGLGLTGVRAQDDETVNYLHCLLVTSQIAAVDDAQISNAGAIATMYWLGRLDERAPGLDLASLITTESEKMTAEVMQAESLRCGAILRDRGMALVELGKVLQGEVDKQSDPSPEQLTP